MFKLLTTVPLNNLNAQSPEVNYCFIVHIIYSVKYFNGKDEQKQNVYKNNYKKYN